MASKEVGNGSAESSESGPYDDDLVREKWVW
jgi:hypothetical protein